MIYDHSLVGPRSVNGLEDMYQGTGVVHTKSFKSQMVYLLQTKIDKTGNDNIAEKLFWHKMQKCKHDRG